MAQAESTWVSGTVPRWFTRPKTVTHPGTNRARRRVTALIESNALPLSQIDTITSDRSSRNDVAMNATLHRSKKLSNERAVQHDWFLSRARSRLIMMMVILRDIYRVAALHDVTLDVTSDAATRETC